MLGNIFTNDKKQTENYRLPRFDSLEDKLKQDQQGYIYLELSKNHKDPQGAKTTGNKKTRRRELGQIERKQLEANIQEVRPAATQETELKAHKMKTSAWKRVCMVGVTLLLFLRDLTGVCSHLICIFLE